MNVIVVFGIVIGLVVTTTTVAAAPAPGTRCSPIIPEENCRNALSAEEAVILATAIASDLADIDDILLNLRNLTTESTHLGPYRLDNAGDRQCLPETNPSDCIARSVYRLKCEVPFVADVVKIESIRELVREESNYATEFKKILKKMRVLLDLKSLISRYQPLNSCTVPENTCPTVTFSDTARLDRLVVMQSIAEDLFRLLADLQRSIRVTDF